MDDLILLCDCGSADVQVIAGREPLVTSVGLGGTPCARRVGAAGEIRVEHEPHGHTLRRSGPWTGSGSVTWPSGATRRSAVASSSWS